MGDSAEVVIRVLGPDEMNLLRGVGLFEIFQLPDMSHTIPVIAQEVASGKIVAYWLIFDAVHVEPFWIAPEHRKRPGLLRRLWGEVLKQLDARKVPIAFACIGDNDAASNLPQAARMGFKRVPGSLFYIQVVPENREGWKSAGDYVTEVLQAHQAEKSAKAREGEEG